ncbi:hypothetical protein BG07_5381 (plasmid) [Bacillus pseudomycoides]|nr:hypothetical protein BG07_5381 [Bacillus pseudomycoides]
MKNLDLKLRVGKWNVDCLMLRINFANYITCSRGFALKGSRYS